MANDPNLEIPVYPEIQKTQEEKLIKQSQRIGSRFSRVFKRAAKLVPGLPKPAYFDKEGVKAGNAFSRGFKRATKNLAKTGLFPDRAKAEVAGTKAGSGFSSGFNKAAKGRLKKEVFPNEVAGQRAGSKAGSGFASGFNSSVKQKLAPGLPKAKDVGLPGSEQGSRDGLAYSSAFDKVWRTRLGRAMDALPKLSPDMELSKNDKAIDSIRTKMKELLKLRVGIDISDADLVKEMADLNAKISRLRLKDIPISTELNLERASAQLKAFGVQAGVSGAEAGKTMGDRFETSVKAKLKAAAASLPKIKIDADSSEADKDLARLKIRMEGLGNAKIGVNMDTNQFKREAAEVYALAKKLTTEDVDVKVRVNTIAAVTQLKILENQIDRVNTKKLGNLIPDVTPIREFTIAYTALYATIGAVIGGLAVMAVPIIAVLIAQMGALLVALTAVVALFGVLAAGIGAIVSAYGKMKDNQEAAAQASEKLASAQQKEVAAQKTLSDSYQNLQDARKSAKRQAEDSAEAVADAERDLARVIQDNIDEEIDARDSLTEARKDAANALIEGNRRVQSAEADLVNAKQNVRDIDKEIIELRKEDIRLLDDLNLRIKENANDQLSAQSRLQQAQKALQDAYIKRDGKEIADAQEQLREAENRLNRSKFEGTKLKDDRDKTKEGGSDATRGAEKRRANAVEAVEKAERSLNRAIQERQRAQEQGESRVAAAQKRVARVQEDAVEREEDARRRVTRSQEDQAINAEASQRRITAAQETYKKSLEGLAQAQREVATAAKDSAAAQQGAIEGINPMLAALLQKLEVFKTEFAKVAEGAAVGMAPGLISAMGAIMPLLEPMKQFASEVGQLFGETMNDAAEALNNPFWTQWGTQMGPTILKVLESIFVSVGNLFGGFAGLSEAFAPFAESWGLSLEDITQKFATWAAGLKDNQTFQDFIAYVNENGPLVATLIGEIVNALVNVGQGAAGPGSDLLQKVTEWLEKLATMDPATIEDFLRRVGSGIEIVIGIIDRWGGAIAIFIATVFTLRTAATVFSAVSTVFSVISGVISTFSGVLGFLGTAINVVRGIWTAFTVVLAANPIGAVIAIIGLLVGALYLFFTKTEAGKKLWDGFMFMLKQAGEWLKTGFVGAWDIAVGAIDGLKAAGSRVGEWFSKDLPDFFKKAADKIAEFFKPVTDLIQKVKDGIANLKFPEMPSFSLPGRAQGGYLPGRARGGYIPGPYRGATADNVLGVSSKGVPFVRVNPGEFLLSVMASKAMSKAYGPEVLEWLRTFHLHKGKRPGGPGVSLPGRAHGGVIPSVRISRVTTFNRTTLPGYAMGGSLPSVRGVGGTSQAPVDLSGMEASLQELADSNYALAARPIVLQYDRREVAKMVGDSQKLNTRGLGK